MKIKTNDNVLIIAGKDRGKRGKVMRVQSTKNKVVVEKVNIVTKHIKKTPQRPGQIIKFEAPINASNVVLVCPNCKKPARVGYNVPAQGKKQRICKKCRQVIETASSAIKKVKATS